LLAAAPSQSLSLIELSSQIGTSGFIRSGLWLLLE